MFGIFMDIFEIKKEILLGVSVLVLYISYYLVEVVKVPTVVGGGDLARIVSSEVCGARERFWPAPWCVEARLQTAAATLIRARVLAAPEGGWIRKTLRLKDGGTVGLDWAGSVPKRDAQRILLLLPGIAGGAHADYARLTYAAALRLRANLAVLNYRGHSGLPLTSPRLSGGVSHDDVAEVVSAIRAAHPYATLLATGVSLGGLLLGQYLATAGKEAKVAAALLISPPLDVERGAISLHAGAANAALRRHVTLALRRALAPHASLLGPAWEATSRCTSPREFDALFSAKHFGFSSAEDYYAAASLKHKLGDICAPTVALCAADDPFQPIHALPLTEAASAEHVALVVLSRGGHVAFADTWRGVFAPSSDAFLAKFIHDYFATLLKRPDMLHGTNREHNLIINEDEQESKTLEKEKNIAPSTATIDDEDEIDYNVFTQYYKDNINERVNKSKES